MNKLCDMSYMSSRPGRSSWYSRKPCSCQCSHEHLGTHKPQDRDSR